MAKGSETKVKVDGEVDALFTLPLAEFIGARNALAARLKQGGRGDEADRVKALAKPPVSAWAVNQLYWKHREAFDRLLATGQQFRQAQASLFAGKVADTRGPLDARRGALSDLSRLAAALLRDAGHTPTPDKMLRITATLEAMSAYEPLPDAPPPGRLTGDVDPPGFESLASLVPGASPAQRAEEPRRVTTNPPHETEATHKARIASAKASLQNAERVLTEARSALRKAGADAKEAERHKREAEERLEKARAESEDAAGRARTVAAEAEAARKAVIDAERTVEKASEEFRSLSR